MQDRAFGRGDRRRIKHEISGGGDEQRSQGRDVGRLKTVIEIAYMGIDPNSKVCVVRAKRRMILMIDLC